MSISHRYRDINT